MEIIRHLNTLKSLCKKYGFKVDTKFKYILVEPNLKNTRYLKSKGYEIKYITGCFYPYLMCMGLKNEHRQ